MLVIDYRQCLIRASLIYTSINLHNFSPSEAWSIKERQTEPVMQPDENNVQRNGKNVCDIICVDLAGILGNVWRVLKAGEWWGMGGVSPPQPTREFNNMTTYPAEVTN